MEMEGGSMEAAHRLRIETTVDNLSRVLRWFDESTAEELRELTSRQRQPQLQRTDFGNGAAFGMDRVDREQLTQPQHPSDYGTIEALQTWFTQQATDEASRHETIKDSRTMSRWCQQIERYRHSFLQWYANYLKLKGRLAAASGELEREGAAETMLINGPLTVEEITTGTDHVHVQPEESKETAPSRMEVHRTEPSRPPKRGATSRKRNYCETEQCTRPMDSQQPHGTREGVAIGTSRLPGAGLGLFE